MRRRGLIVALAVAASFAPAAARAQAPATARAAGRCGSVHTRKGGTAKYVYAIKLRCRTARRVARRANGHRYRYHGFRCKPVSGLYSCYKPGTSKGIGFSYHRH